MNWSHFASTPGHTYMSLFANGRQCILWGKKISKKSQDEQKNYITYSFMQENVRKINWKGKHFVKNKFYFTSKWLQKISLSKYLTYLKYWPNSEVTAELNVLFQDVLFQTCRTLISLTICVLFPPELLYYGFGNN